VAAGRTAEDELDFEIASHPALEDPAHERLVVEDERDLVVLGYELPQPFGQRARGVRNVTVVVLDEQVLSRDASGGRGRIQIGLRLSLDQTLHRVPGLFQARGQRVARRCEDGRAREGLPRFERKQIGRTGPGPNNDETSHRGLA